MQASACIKKRCGPERGRIEKRLQPEAASLKSRSSPQAQGAAQLQPFFLVHLDHLRDFAQPEPGKVAGGDGPPLLGARGRGSG